MDVNGTRFHLYKGQPDWQRCRLDGQPTALPNWIAFSRLDHAPAWLHLAWTEESGLTLAPQLARFPRSRCDRALEPASRRGAAVDHYGNWYWISYDAQRIFWSPAGTGRPALFWEQRPVITAKAPGAFAPSTPALFTPVTLGGLTVTSHHYLVVGNVTETGLLLFDLHRGGEPMRVTLPAATLFEPFDMAAAPDGGIWVLDRVNYAYWAFDRTFQVRGYGPQLGTPVDTLGFQPVATKEQPPVAPDLPIASPPGEATGYDLRGLNDPIAIEGGPGQSVFILDQRPGAEASVLYQFAGATEMLQLALADTINVVTLDGASEQEEIQVVAHDLAYVAREKRIYVVERDGNQALAFQLFPDGSPPGLRLATSYLPMQNFGARALVRVGEALYYDLTGRNAANDRAVRWVQLQPFDEPRYQRTGALVTPVLDGRTHDCVWHRLLVDGCLPPETTVELWTRAHNDPALLATVPFTRQPDLYLRSAGTEIATYAAFTATQRSKAGVGTWEVLCQQVQGRYAQVRLVLRGSGRMTPQVGALRAYYPRFSYAKEYLPAVYGEDRASASFLERLLANPEGFYSEIEGKIRTVHTLFDGRSAPPEALDWLAGWLGLIVDPIWATIQARRQAENGRTGNGGTIQQTQRTPDRRRLFIRFARRLYERRGTPDGIKFALQLLLEPCLEELLARFQRAAVHPNPTLAMELERYGLAPPTPTTSAQGFEDLLYAYLLAPLRPSTVRLVERYQTRNGRAVAAGDPTQGGQEASSTTARLNADAHRFAVLIPEDLTPEEEAMVRRIVTLEKPAHTLFEVRRYWDYYRVGEARLGLDTLLGESSRFTPLLLGRDYLAEGFLAADHPFSATERLTIHADEGIHL